MRHWIAWPRGAGFSRSDIGSPRAIRIISATRSTPYTISVTGCSTWIRVFISRKKKRPSFARLADAEVDDFRAGMRGHGGTLGALNLLELVDCLRLAVLAAADALSKEARNV